MFLARLRRPFEQRRLEHELEHEVASTSRPRLRQLSESLMQIPSTGESHCRDVATQILFPYLKAAF